MPNDQLASLHHLSDVALVARVKALAARERGATAELVAHLAELDTRDLHLRAGYPSLFAYCRDALGLSEHEAYNRIEVARASRRFPVILRMLAAGSVNLTTARLLAPHLTFENHQRVLDSARGKGKAGVEEIVARLSPRPDVPASVRKLPAPRVAAPLPATLLPQSAPGETSGASARSAPLQAHMSQVGSPRRPVEVTALAPDRYKLQLTIGGQTLEKLRLAKDMLRHAIPSGDEAAILDRALTVLLGQLALKQVAATGKPRSTRATPSGSRHIPAAVKRTVWRRDLGCCAFVGTTGHRCGERAFVQFHHVKPYAAGGEASASNIALRCVRHNDHEAREYFGRFRRDDAPPELVPERVGLSSRSPRDKLLRLG